MKKIFLALLILCIAFNGFAQRKVDETFKVANGQKVKLHLKFAKEIKIVQASGNDIRLTATVNIDEGAGNSAYQLKTSDASGVFQVEDDYGDYFEKKRKESNGNSYGTNMEISYVIYVPENISLIVKSISGDLVADNFKGELETDLVSGDVNIKGYKGKLQLKSVSGNLDVAMNAGNIDAKTVTGTIYSDLDINIQNKKEGGYSSHIKGTVNDGKELVKLETVSGNIYMRKK
jgi:hypothetical protein